MLFSSEQVAQVYGPVRLQGMQQTLNFCGSEMDRAKSSRPYSAEAVSDKHTYSCMKKLNNFHSYTRISFQERSMIHSLLDSST